MKRAQIIGISIAGAAGLCAFMLMKGFLGKSNVREVDRLVDASEVLVASSNISLGEITNQGHFRWQVWPKSAVTPGFIVKAPGSKISADLAGSIARAPLLAGEPVTQNKLIKPGQGGVLAAILPAGMRAISTKIKEETAAGRLILPNDYVDVILTRRFKGRNGQDDAASSVLLSNVRILAIGQQIETKEGKKSSEQGANTATLELSPVQSEELARADSLGEISLALRSIADAAHTGGPTSGAALAKPKTTGSVHVMRYGVRSQAFTSN